MRRRLWVRGRGGRGVAVSSALAALAVAALLTGLAGCGGGSSSTSTGPRRAAEPADAPPLRATPAGTVAPVGHEPEGLVWDAAAGLFAVGGREPAQLVFVDPQNLAVKDRVPLPAPPRHLAYDAVSRAVLVPAESADELLVVRPGGVVSATKVGRHPHDATAAGDEVFVADEHSDQVSVVRGGRVIKTLPTPHQPGGIATSAGRWIGLVAVSARVLEVYDARTLKPVGRLPAGVGPSHIVTGPTAAYVADTQGEQILVYDLGRHPALVGEVAAPGTPYGLAVDPRRHRLWVTETATNRLAEYSTRGKLPHLLTTFPTVRQPNSVAVEPRTGAVYVAGRASGRLQRISPNRKDDR